MNILRIISSPRGEESYSTKLGNAIVAHIQQAHPGSHTITRNLTTNPMPYQDDAHVSALFAPPEAHTPAMEAAIHRSDETIQELMDANAIVIDAPMYNFTITATLKSWLDHIIRAGKTFSYSAAGVEGLVKNKKVYLAIATGGIYSEGPMKAYDFNEPYLRTLLGFIGISDLTTFRVEGMNLPHLKETALPKALATLSLATF